MRLSLVAVLLLVPCMASAQVVETPEPFDSAGRVMSLTPAMAARLSLGPPVWRVVGDFSAARLYSIGGDAYVLTVTRPTGAVERYSLTAADRQYLRERVSALPAQMLVRDRGDRGAFIRNQTLLGLLVYGPAFATAITNDDAGGASAYLLVAGATFFGASQIARDYTVTPAMRSLSTHGALHAAASAGALAYAFDASESGTAASIFIGGVGGAAAGLLLANHMTSGEAVAAGFGADVAALTMLGAIAATQGGENLDSLKRIDAALLVAAVAVGYPLGYLYPRSVRYNVTGGDIGTLWLSGLLGASTAGIFLTDGNLENRTESLALTAGFLGGIVAGDRILVKRFDHSSGDAALLGLSAIAGGLVGLGVANLIDSEDDSGRLDLSMFTAGAIGGVAVTHGLIAPGADQGRFASRLRFNPSGLGLAAAGVRGAHPVFSFSF